MLPIAASVALLSGFFMHWNDKTWTFPSAAISVHLQLWISKHRPEFTWMTILIGKNFYSHPFFYRWLSRSRRSQGSQDYASVNPEFRSSEVLLSSHSVFPKLMWILHSRRYSAGNMSWHGWVAKFPSLVFWDHHCQTGPDASWPLFAEECDAQRMGSRSLPGDGPG